MRRQLKYQYYLSWRSALKIPRPETHIRPTLTTPFVPTASKYKSFRKPKLKFPVNRGLKRPPTRLAGQDFRRFGINVLINQPPEFLFQASTDSLIAFVVNNIVVFAGIAF